MTPQHPPHPANGNSESNGVLHYGMQHTDMLRDSKLIFETQMQTNNRNPILGLKLNSSGFIMCENGLHSQLRNLTIGNFHSCNTNFDAIKTLKLYP